MTDLAIDVCRLESLCEDKLYRGSQKKLYDLIDACSGQRPEASVCRLMDYRAQGLFPAMPGWLRGLNDLLEKHYRRDSRVAVRVKSLAVLLEIFRSNRHMYEEDLVEKAVAPFLRPLDAEDDLQVRLEGIKARELPLFLFLPPVLTSLVAGLDLCLLRVQLEGGARSPGHHGEGGSEGGGQIARGARRQRPTRRHQGSRLRTHPGTVAKGQHPKAFIDVTRFVFLRYFRPKLCQPPAAFLLRTYNHLAEAPGRPL